MKSSSAIFSNVAAAKSFIHSSQGFRRLFTSGSGRYWVALTKKEAAELKAAGFAPLSILG